MRSLLLLCLLGVLVGATPAAYAQPAEEIAVAGTVVMRIRASAGGLSAAERARAIRQRINLALTSEDLTPTNMFLQAAGSGVTIKVGRVTIVTVTPADAAATGTTVVALARRWLGALRVTLPRAKPVNQP